MLARLFALLLLAVSPALAADDAYLAAWNGMLAGEKVPQWVKTYAKDFNGPATPSTQVPVGGQPYTLAWVCKAHDCGDSQLYVLFAPEARQAWGLLISAGDKRRWLGKPDAAVQAAILSGVQ